MVYFSLHFYGLSRGLIPHDSYGTVPDTIPTCQVITDTDLTCQVIFDPESDR
jgi:hypothetical protein